MSRASGLNRQNSILARDRAVQAAMLGLHNAGALHYTQDSRRWEGIDEKLIARHGQFPHHADCSAFATWCLWNGLAVPFKMGDIVNGEHWQAGFTGTLAQHGLEVTHGHRVRRADLVLYGPAPTFEHVAIIVGEKNGDPIVVSNGSEGGPYFLPYNYRSDVGQIRRYI